MRFTVNQRHIQEKIGKIIQHEGKAEGKEKDMPKDGETYKGGGGTLRENDTIDTEESGILSRYDASSSGFEGSEEGEYDLEMNPTLKRWLLPLSGDGWDEGM